MAAASPARLPTAARQWLLDGTIALAAFAGEASLMAHGGLGSTGTVAHHLDAVGLAVAACRHSR